MNSEAVGVEVFNNNKYTTELYIKVLKDEFKNQIVEAIRNANWCELFPMTKSPRLKQWQVNKYVNDMMESAIKEKVEGDDEERGTNL